MSHKQVEDMISDYFHELLGHPAANEENSAVDKNINKKPLDSPKVLAAREASVEPEPIGSTKIHKESKTEKSRDTEINGTTFAQEPFVVIPKQKFSATPRALSVAKNTSDSTLPIKEECPPSEASAYEQHKQRLENILKQVSAFDTSAKSESLAPPEAPSTVPTSPSVDKPDTPISYTEEASDAVPIAEVYQDIPTLSSEWLDNGRPNWAQERFDILLVEVNGLQLAVPLVALGQIQTMDENLTPLFGQSDWFMGLQQSPIGNIKTVNTAKFVMPERYQNEHNYKYVVSINGLHWGLAVDSIHQPISVSPDAIRWRVNRSNRPWMAGMVKDHMCVLLDIPALGEILQKQDKNRQEATGGKT